MKLLEVKNLSIRYGDFLAVKGVTFAVEKGGIFGIVGESGSGKSTIAKALMGLKEADSGEIVFQNKTKAQMIFQDAAGSLNPRMKVCDTLKEVLCHYGRSKLEAKKEAAQLVELVGLPPAVLDQYPHEMSGGQCQRVSIARALACGSEVLIADEPVSALDVSVQARILNLLRALNKSRGVTIVLIAHDLAVVKNICDEVIVLEKGVVVDSGEPESVFSAPKSEYTKSLIAAVPGKNLKPTHV
ncbi:MAG: ABC transporter ATP-binding protein [Kiritimatiellae bacterium]|nr:ABC transporter ATP-binding protein [Kiritimatiellia bacterium]